LPRNCVVKFVAMKLSLSRRSFQVPLTPLTFAWPPRLPSVPTSRATRVTSSANDESWSTIVLIVFLRRRISPFASTVILRVRSPWATAVVTSAMFRTWFVRLSAIPLTDSVSPRQTPDTPSTSAAPPSLPSEPTSRAVRPGLSCYLRDLLPVRRQLVDHRVDRVLELENLAPDVDGDLLGQVAVRDRRRHLGDVAHLRRQVRRHAVHVVREVLPG